MKNAADKSKMRGGIRKRGEKSYLVCISLGKDPSTGKYKYLNQTVRGTLQEAKAHRAKLIHEIAGGTFVTPSKLTLGEYLERWLKEYARANLAPRTAEGYELIIRRHLIPALGRIKLSALKPEHVQRYIAEKLSSGRADGKGGLSRRTVRHHYMALHTALRHAVKLGLLSRNAADGVSPPSCSRHEWHCFDESELNRLLEAAKTSPYYVFFYQALFTGMRRSELLGLRWRDVDLVLCEAHVSRSLHQLRTGEIVIRPPKSKQGFRTVDLPLSAALLLQDYKDKQAVQRVVKGTRLSEDDLIFSNVEGKPLLPNTVTHAWVKLVRRAGLKGVRLHDCRHSHASIMLKQGTHPKVVQERLGHASIQVTIDIYSHVAPGIQKAAAENFDKLVSPKHADTCENECSDTPLLTNY